MMEEKKLETEGTIKNTESESCSMNEYLEEKRKSTSIPVPEVPAEKEETEEEKLKRLKKQYAESEEKVFIITTTVTECDDEETEYTFIFKKPRPASYDRYVKAVSNSATKATKMFAQDNIIPEQLEYLKATFEEYPAMSIEVAGKLLNMLGLSSNTMVKKL